MRDQRNVPVVIADLIPAEEHSHAVFSGNTAREPLPAERRLLLLLAASRRTAQALVQVHDQGSEWTCSCHVCETAVWLLASLEFAYKSIAGELC